MEEGVLVVCCVKPNSTPPSPVPSASCLPRYVSGWTVVCAVLSLLFMDMDASETHQYIISACMVGINISILVVASYYQYVEG